MTRGDQELVRAGAWNEVLRVGVAGGKRLGGCGEIFAVGAFLAGRRWGFGIEGGFDALQCGHDPGCVAFVMQEGDAEFQSRIEGGRLAVAIRVDKPCGVRNRKSALAEEPLVKLDLAFVGNLPFAIDGGLVFFGCGFVIGHNEYAGGGIDPDVVQCTVDFEAGGCVEGAETFAEVPPVRQFVMAVGDESQPGARQQGRRGPGVAMGVELAFHELVHGIIECEGQAGRAGDTKALVEVKTPRALVEELHFCAAQRERLVGFRSVEILFGHALPGEGGFNFPAVDLGKMPGASLPKTLGARQARRCP